MFFDRNNAEQTVLHTQYTPVTSFCGSLVAMQWIESLRFIYPFTVLKIVIPFISSTTLTLHFHLLLPISSWLFVVKRGERENLFEAIYVLR